MDLRRPGLGEWLVGLAGVALLVSLFLPWTHSAAAAGSNGCCPRVSGWRALTAIDVVLAVVAALALAVLVAAVTQRTAAVPMAAATLTIFAGVLAVILTVIRVLAPPGDAGAGVGGGRLVGLWLALGSSLAVAASALIAVRDERPREPGDRPIPVRPLPAPGPAAAARSAGGYTAAEHTG